MRFVIICILITTASGCAVQQERVTRDEFLKFSTKEYFGFNQQQIISASEELFNLSDGNDYEFSYTKNGITAGRFYNVYMVLAVDQGNIIWNIETFPTDDGVIVEVIVENHKGGFLSPTTTFAYNDPANYELYFKRLDYMLGISDTWLTCELAKSVFEEREDVWGVLDPWCYVTNDAVPASPLIKTKKSGVGP
ncbi:hypothetical protein [Thiohalomonas denitrificans]|uniref:Lipoprotein n=1 Tax=Thiohalomonas denitrificans TaxID=415747 RepID=A0A1G5PHV5_9GAMM|nr:hypothetical protein [Thiohalomonas denitrificans]SCZ49047.1 hypothetical protein SAMN03097708_00002 [Thiohalomonas denitrificans]